MATYNGTSGNGTYLGGATANPLMGFAGNDGLSGISMAGLFVAAADQETADHSISAADVAINIPEYGLSDARPDGPANSPFDQVVG
jgi:hypothetical protein